MSHGGEKGSGSSLLAAAALAGRVSAGAALLLSGFSKLSSAPEEFAFVMESYRLLPLRVVMPLSKILPWVETGVGLLLLAGLFLRAASAAAAVLFSVFMAALASTLVRGIDLGDCGCFGKWG